MRHFINFLSVLFLLPSVIKIRAFDISITGGEIPNVLASGLDWHFATWAEMELFGLNEDKLKDLVEKYKGSRPDDAAICDPTPFGPDRNEYIRYMFAPVSIVVEAHHAEILESTTNFVQLSQKIFINNSTEVGTYMAQISETETNTLESTWSTETTFTMGQTVSINFAIVEFQTSFSAAYMFQEGWSKSYSSTVGDLSEISVTLDPGKTVAAALTAKKKKLNVRVYYTAYLNGQIVVNYSADKDRFLDGHHVWAFDVNVLGIGRSSLTKEISQDILIDYYVEGKVELGSV